MSPEAEPTEPSVPKAESIFSLREVSRLREIPYEVESALWTNAPQALLRDLHRPVVKFGVNPLEFARIERVIDGGRSAIRDIKQIMVTSYQLRLTDLLATPKVYRETIAERRQIMKGPWADAPKLGAAKYTVSGLAWS